MNHNFVEYSVLGRDFTSAAKTLEENKKIGEAKTLIFAKSAGIFGAENVIEKHKLVEGSKIAQ